MNAVSNEANIDVDQDTLERIAQRDAEMANWFAQECSPEDELEDGLEFAYDENDCLTLVVPSWVL